MADLFLTGRDVSFSPDELIVSKTDPRGIITYANDVFIRVSGYRESELLGKPHSLIRHPHMPRCAFKLLWDTLKTGQEIFAYVLNRTKTGDEYWVLAHVTPTFDSAGDLIGYHSSRRVPERRAIDAIWPIYQQLFEMEQRIGGNRGMEAAFQHLVELLAKNKTPYDRFVLAL